MRDPIFVGTDATSFAPAAASPPVSYADYLAVEEKSPLRHEFFGGKIRAMAGGTPRHATLCTNVIGRLFMGLNGKPCQPKTSDQKVRVDEVDEAFYPDALVVCPPEQFSPFDKNALVNPVLIVEVLSPGTRDVDKNQKFAAYLRIPSLRHLIFIEPDFIRLEHFSRANEGEDWKYRVYYERADSCPIESLEMVLLLEEIYRGVEAPDAYTLFKEQNGDAAR